MITVSKRKIVALSIAAFVVGASLIISAGLIVAGSQVDIDTIVKINKEGVQWQTLSTRKLKNLGNQRKQNEIKLLDDWEVCRPA